MKRTSAATLAVLVAAGGVAMFLLQTFLVSTGGARYEPALSLPAALVVIAVLVVVLAMPVRRSVRGRSPRKVDPFYATRIVLLAKACSLSGALLGGAFAGAVVFLWTRSVTGVGSLAMALASLVGAILLLAAGLIAEHLCTVPPDDDERGRPSVETIHP
ncbi:MAG: DUF3180 domain-containing protein [Micrococcales bacterium]|nr:DUF3180 domain-containing protein [Micrococcales bacterium]